MKMFNVDRETQKKRHKTIQIPMTPVSYKNAKKKRLEREIEELRKKSKKKPK